MLIKVIGITIACLIGANLFWRFASRRWSLPCPTVLAWGLETPLTGFVMGTEKTLDHLGLYPGQRVLEIGPGPGRLLIPAALHVLPDGEAVGLDIQPGMIERLKTRVERAGISNLKTEIGDGAEPHFEPESFDLVFLCTALGEIPDRKAVLEQCFRVLKTGGRLSITELLPDPHYQRRSKVRQFAEGVGFQFDLYHGHGYFYTANFVKPESHNRNFSDGSAGTGASGTDTGKRLRVLVADHDENTLASFGHCLAEAGYAVELISDGTEAMTMALSSHYGRIVPGC